MTRLSGAYTALAGTMRRELKHPTSAARYSPTLALTTAMPDLIGRAYAAAVESGESLLRDYGRLRQTRHRTGNGNTISTQKVQVVDGYV